MIAIIGDYTRLAYVIDAGSYSKIRKRHCLPFEIKYTYNKFKWSTWAIEKVPGLIGINSSLLN